MMRIFTLLTGLLAAIISARLVTAQPYTVTVDAANVRGTISPYVYGANLGLYSIIPLDLMDEAQALNLNFIRFGGGVSDEQNVQKPQLDLFIYQVRQLEAEPLITVRLLDGTPEDAAEVVRYINIEKGYGVRFWSIGNEPNLFTALFDAPYDTATLNAQWRAIAEAMRAVDPTISLFAPDITQYVVQTMDGETLTYMPPEDGGWALDPDGRDWLIEFLRANGDLVSVVSIHRYPYPGIGDTRDAIATIDGLRDQADEWETAIPNLRAVVREAAGRDIPIAVTEFNSNSSPSCGAEASLDSHYNALWVGDTLGRLITQGVEYVAYWDMQGIGNRCWGLLNQRDVRPTYYAYRMYAHFGSELLQSSSDAPDVRAYAARRDDGTLTLLLINMGMEATTVTLSLANFTPDGDAEVWRFDPDHAAAMMDAQAINDGSEIALPGQSMSVYLIPNA
jgi:hypothetical protein